MHVKSCHRLNEFVSQVEAAEMEEVVVTGIFERKKVGFTGSANRMSGEEISKLTSGNVLNAIQMLDPGFRMGDNIMSGSNPNAIPEFNMRGQASMGDYSTVSKSVSGKKL